MTTKADVEAKVQRILARNFNTTLREDGFAIKRGSSVTLVRVLDDPIPNADKTEDLWMVRITALILFDVDLTEELARDLACRNHYFGNLYYRENDRAIVLGQTLVGNTIDEDELELTTYLMSRAGDDWDDELQSLYGGRKVLETP